jgi:hypothetical protein
MRQILIFILALIANFVIAQNIEKITIPKGVVYNYCENSIIEEAKKLIKENLTNENDYSLLQANLIVGPTLWKTFKNVESLQEVGTDAVFHIDDLEVSGKMCQDLNDTKKMWNELKKEISANFKIRKANQDELAYYWATIPFDIDEPLLIVETENHNYILNILPKDLKLMWLDEFPLNEKYYNPIENTTYVAEGGFKTYQNGEEVNITSKGEKETKLEKVVLLSSDEELKKNTSVEDIKNLMDKTSKIFEKLFKNSEKSGKIMVQFELGKEKNIIQFAVRNDLDLETMKEFEKRVNEEKYPKTKNGTVKLQLIYKVNSFDD